MKNMVKIKINEEIRAAVVELFGGQIQSAGMDEIAEAITTIESKVLLGDNMRVMQIADGCTTGQTNAIVLSSWRLMDIKRLRNLLNAIMREVKDE